VFLTEYSSGSGYSGTAGLLKALLYEKPAQSCPPTDYSIIP